MTLSSVLYDYKHVVIFYSVLILLIYLNRKKFEFQGKFIALYRTNIGIKLMNKISSKYREWVKLFGYISIGIGYVGLVAIFVLLLKVVYEILFKRPGAVGASPVLPGIPIAGTGLVFPLIIGWITLFIIIVVHEFSHGVVARAFNLKVLNTGIVFFGPILGAFVEPDEKELKKRPDIEQYSIFAAGPISNIVLTLIVLLISGFIMTPLLNSVSEGVGVSFSLQEGFPAKASGMPDGAIVTVFNGNKVVNIDDFLNYSKKLNVGDTVTLMTSEGAYRFDAVEHPDDPERGYMGVVFKSNEFEAKQGFNILYLILKWFAELFFWIAFISVNIGLINLFPIFITDGARMLKVSVDKIVPDKKKALRIWTYINKFALLILLLLLVIPLFRWVVKLII